MSLDYDLTAIVNSAEAFPLNTEHVQLVGSLNLKLHAMVWGTIATGIGELKDEAEADEFFYRYVFWTRLFGQHEDGELPFTRQDCRMAVGLKTNVFPRQKRSEWLERMFDRHEQDLKFGAQ